MKDEEIWLQTVHKCMSSFGIENAIKSADKILKEHKERFSKAIPRSTVGTTEIRMEFSVAEHDKVSKPITCPVCSTEATRLFQKKRDHRGDIIVYRCDKCSDEKMKLS